MRRLPGVGVKSAQRMAWHLLQHDREGALRIAGALTDAVARIRHCARCHTFTEAEVCSICLDPSRDVRQLAVVETPADQAALERTGSYRGLYFVLMGRLSPLDGVGPSEIGARQLNVQVGGSGTCDTERLTAADVRVSIAGSGDARVRAENALSAAIAGSGDLYYRGAATPKISIVGSGRVKRI